MHVVLIMVVLVIVLFILIVVLSIPFFLEKKFLLFINFLEIFARIWEICEAINRLGKTDHERIQGYFEGLARFSPVKCAFRVFCRESKGEGGTAASTKAMGSTSSSVKRSKVSGVRLMPLSGIWNRRKGEILDSIYGSMESIFFTRRKRICWRGFMELNARRN